MNRRILSKIFISFFFTVIFAYSSYAQTPVPGIEANVASSQLVFWYDNGCNENAPIDNCSQDRNAAIQVANTHSSQGVWVHVRVFSSFQASDSPLEITRCFEDNFVDFYTPRDTHTYLMDNMCQNNSVECSSPLQLPRTKGFVLVTPIRSEQDKRPVAFGNLIGSTVVSDGNFNAAFRVNAMGRDAVNFSDNSVLEDGTEINGNTNGFIIVQPGQLSFNTNIVAGTADVVLISFIDQYSDDESIGYTALPGETRMTPFIFDSAETRISCDQFRNSCFNNFGLIDQNLSGTSAPQANNNIDPDSPVCENASVSDDPVLSGLVSWTKLLVTDYEPLENQFGVIAYTESSQNAGGGADWMYSEDL